MSYMGIILQKEKMAYAKTPAWRLEWGAESQLFEGKRKSHLCAAMASITQPNLQHRENSITWCPGRMDKGLRDGQRGGTSYVWLED